MDTIEQNESTRVDDLIRKRRDESDARDIIKEVERLASFEGQQRYRWIWELLQNARDEAGAGVSIKCFLNDQFFVFSHNGKPFKSDHLIALTLRSSTKPLDGGDGNAGKFGTGFVTSHLLNRIVEISGVHGNEEGQRRFHHKLDRTGSDLNLMMESLTTSIKSIKQIDTRAPEPIIDHWNSFTYGLNDTSLEIAKGGINQLKSNLAFALLVNEKTIKSVTVIDNGIERKLTINKSASSVGDLCFVELIDDQEPNSQIGLLYKYYDDLIIAIPAKKEILGFSLIGLNGAARLFKELPLIGTEDFVIPTIIQHKLFMPTEPRDGVRTKRVIADGTESDPIAERNRTAFSEYLTAFPDFLNKLIDGNVEDLHYIAHTGMSADVDKYYGRVWLETEVQNKIRAELLKHKLVMTASGMPIKIEEALFPDAEATVVSLLHELMVEIFPEKTPDQNSYLEWNKIINQDNHLWPKGIMVNIQTLVERMPGRSQLLDIFTSEEKVNEWLQKLVNYIELTKNERLGIDHPIYPTQSNGLATQSIVFHEVDLNERFKSVALGLGRNVANELLPKDFKAFAVQKFNVKEFLNDLNDRIGKLKLNEVKPEELQAVLDICSTFESSRSPKREDWYDIIRRLFHDKINGKSTISLPEEYSWDSAEKWAVKYVAASIESSGTFESLKEKFSEGEDLFKWLNDFIAFAFRNDDTKAAFDYNIVLTQNGKFNKYVDGIYCENAPDDFLPILKTQYKKQDGFGDPAGFLVHSGIKNSNLRIVGIEVLTRPLDDLFKDTTAENQVKDGQKYHELFLILKELTEADRWAKLFPIFTEKQPILFIKAFGAGSSVSRLMKIKKTIDEMEKLASLSLSADQLKQLDDAAKIIGNPQSLIDHAKALAKLAEEIRWRQNVGGAAEDAFLEALKHAHPSFAQPENPDNGKDFVIKIGEDKYSIEIKSAIEGKETVKMSLRQGEDAFNEKEHYALCVISRPSGTLTDKAHFIDHAKFVTDIGFQIGEKVVEYQDGLSKIGGDDNVSVELDSKSGFVNIRKAVWENGITFHQFIDVLKIYFHIL